MDVKQHSINQEQHLATKLYCIVKKSPDFSVARPNCSVDDILLYMKQISFKPNRRQTKRRRLNQPIKAADRSGGGWLDTAELGIAGYNVIQSPDDGSVPCNDRLPPGTRRASARPITSTSLMPSGLPGAWLDKQLLWLQLSARYLTLFLSLGCHMCLGSRNVCCEMNNCLV